MNITVFGATGGVGKELVAQALTHGHTVTAVARDPNRLPISDPALTVLTVAGLQEPDALYSAVRGSDAVLSAVGPRGRSDGPVASSSTRSILSAMHAAQVERIVVVSAAPVGPVPAGEGLINRWLVLPLISRLLRSAYRDLAEMEAALPVRGRVNLVALLDKQCGQHAQQLGIVLDQQQARRRRFRCVHDAIVP